MLRVNPIVATVSTLMLASVAASGAPASPAAPFSRQVQQITWNWKFVASNLIVGADSPAYDDAAWLAVSVPHTWDTPGKSASYTNAWYRTHFPVRQDQTGQRIYIRFEGVFQVADVYVNGAYLGQHRGGYTRFVFDATPRIHFGGDNVLAVRVNNASCADCLPSGQPVFRAYGGIYRKVWILTTNRYHIAAVHFGSSGVYITPKDVSAASADLSIRTMATNDAAEPREFEVQNVLRDTAGKTVLSLSKAVLVAPHSTVAVDQSGFVLRPHLWSGSDPYLYTVGTMIKVDGVIADSIVEHTGFRSYKLTESDFVLNGFSQRLRGIAKHQESEYHGGAMTDGELTEDWKGLQDLGVNFVRLVHYPHAELEYDLADQMGIAVWCENGQTNRNSQTWNGSRLTTEMVYQNWNHPSILFWSAGNEGSGETASSYGTQIRAVDSSRPVVYAGMHLLNRLIGVAGGFPFGSRHREMPGIDYVFDNPYPGWYYLSPYQFVTAVDSAPWISEAGAGGVITNQNPDYFNNGFNPDKHEPEQYMQLNHEVEFQTVFVTKPQAVPVFTVWCARDFGEPRYKGHVNTKGLRTFSNYPKDSYYLYKAFLARSPVLHVVGAHYFLRGGSGAVKVYSNAPSVTLAVNGSAVGVRMNGQYSHPNGMAIRNVFYWDRALRKGRNLVTASDGKGNSDSIVVYLAGAGETSVSEPNVAVANLVSSNRNSPAYFINAPVHDQWGFYCDFDGNGDNTFDVVPAAVAGASWIATKRQSDPKQTANLSFTVTEDADVYIMFTKQPSVPSWVASGFTDAGVMGKWRDNNLDLVDYQLYKTNLSAGTQVRAGGSQIDYVVLVKAHPAVTPQPVKAVRKRL